MKHLDEYRDPKVARSLVDRIHRSASRIAENRDGPVKVMEICGSHTVSIFRAGIKALLPDNVVLVSGPGCPVCVTAMEDMDRMIALSDVSRAEDVIVATFGDMIRVPGTEQASNVRGRGELTSGSLQRPSTPSTGRRKILKSRSCSWEWGLKPHHRPSEPQY